MASGILLRKPIKSRIKINLAITARDIIQHKSEHLVLHNVFDVMLASVERALLVVVVGCLPDSFDHGRVVVGEGGSSFEAACHADGEEGCDAEDGGEVHFCVPS